MMSDKEFTELELRATICPGQCEWPKPENIVWQKLHAVPNEARERLSKVYAQMDKIDGDASLSSDIKYRRRCEIAAQGIADFEASRTLARAREAVELAVAKHNFERVLPEIAQDSEATVKAMKEVERAWQRAMDKIAERAAQTKVPGGARRGALIWGRI
jgi:hypothetical protein